MLTASGAHVESSSSYWNIEGHSKAVLQVQKWCLVCDMLFSQILYISVYSPSNAATFLWLAKITKVPIEISNERASPSVILQYNSELMVQNSVLSYQVYITIELLHFLHRGMGDHFHWWDWGGQESGMLYLAASAFCRIYFLKIPKCTSYFNVREENQRFSLLSSDYPGDEKSRKLQFEIPWQFPAKC